MANITFTATAIKPIVGSTVLEAGKLGEAAITQGMGLYQSASDSKWYIADCTAAATDAVSGIAMGAGGTDQLIQVATGGDITCDGLSLSIATADPIIVLSEAGALMPSSDLAADDYISVVGAAKAVTRLSLGFLVTGVQATA